MKALVYHCRWLGASLRLRGRDETAVWGHFVFRQSDGSERTEYFTYDLQARRLTRQTKQGEVTVTLDEMGVIVR